MHRSRLSTFVIDCKVEDIDAAPRLEPGLASRAGLRRIRRPGVPAADGVRGRADAVLQKVSHDSRIHLDIETDNLEAEVARLEKLGRGGSGSSSAGG